MNVEPLGMCTVWLDVKHRQIRRLQTSTVKATQLRIDGRATPRNTVVELGAARCLCRGLSRVMGNYHARF